MCIGVHLENFLLSYLSLGSFDEFEADADSGISDPAVSRSKNIASDKFVCPLPRLETIILQSFVPFAI